jgi:hypothetical protein
MLAFAMLATIRHRANCGREKITGQRFETKPKPWSAGRCKKFVASPPAWGNGVLSQLMSLLGHFGDGPIKPPLNVRI